MTAAGVRPGDVLCTRSGGWQGWLIRFGAALRDQPSLSNHIAVAHHTDAHGTLWAVEGRPGGAGWVDARNYRASSWTVTNAEQPKTDAQRQAVCDVMVTMVGTEYDYAAILADSVACLGWQLPGWDPSWHGQVPGMVVCSSLAAYGYTKGGLRCPAGEREVTPGMWDAWVLTKGWLR